MRHIASLIATAALAAVPVVGVAATAEADTPGCVTRAEYGKVDTGWSLERVHNLFDTDGHRTGFIPGTAGHPAVQYREYRTCSSRHGNVDVAYKRVEGVWRVTRKHAVFV